MTKRRGCDWLIEINNLFLNMCKYSAVIILTKRLVWMCHQHIWGHLVFFLIGLSELGS